MLKQEKVANIQAALADLGLYNGEVDGLWGPKTERAFRSYMQLSDSTAEEASAELLNAEHLLTPQELYDSATYTPVRNAISTGVAYAKNFISGQMRKHAPRLLKHLRLGERSLNHPSEGTKRLAIALYLKRRPKNADRLIAKNGSITFRVGNKNKRTYVWQDVNGGYMPYDKERNVAEKAAFSPGEFTLGDYTVVETPDEYIITDTYNFNNKDTKSAQAAKNVTWYDALRDNVADEAVGQEVNWRIPKSQVREWRKEAPKGGTLTERFEAFWKSLNPFD